METDFQAMQWHGRSLSLHHDHMISGAIWPVDGSLATTNSQVKINAGANLADQALHRPFRGCGLSIELRVVSRVPSILSDWRN
jgi:hypothetical protein